MKATDTAKLIQNRGCAPCINMHFLCIYAHFMQLLYTFTLIVLHILSMPKWHIFGLKTATLSRLRALGGRSNVPRKKAVKPLHTENRALLSVFLHLMFHTYTPIFNTFALVSPYISISYARTMWIYYKYVVTC